MSGTRKGRQHPNFLRGGGQLGALIRDRDWSDHPFGEPETWPQSLRSALSICLNSSFPTAIYWGDELRLLYNDAWASIPAERHPWALGRPGAEVWADIWDVVGPQFERVLATGEGYSTFDQMLPMVRQGIPTETYWNYSITPIHGEDGRVVGIFNQGNETTPQVLARRQAMAEIDRLGRMFEQAPGAVVILRGPTHVVENANLAYEALVGRTDLKGRPIAEALPEIVAQGFVALLDQVFETGRPYVGRSVPVSLARRGSEPQEQRWLDFVYQPLVDAAGACSGIFVQATDVSETEQALAALRASEQELQTLADTLPVLVAYVDRDQRYRFVNNAYGTWFPSLRDRMVGRPVREVIGRQAYDVVRPRIEAAMAGEAVTFEQLMPYDEGQERHIRVQYVPRLDAEGKVEGLYSLVQDISAEKRVELALRSSEARLQFLHRLDEALLASRDASAAMSVAATLLANRLDVSRCAYADVDNDSDNDRFVIRNDWTAPGIESSVGTYSLELFGPRASSDLRAGRTLVLADVASELAASEGRDMFHAIGIDAIICCPLVRDGRVVAMMAVHQDRPRNWHPDEVALVQSVVERCWSHVQRVGAEARLRESEARFQAIANSIDQMIWSTRPDGFHDYYNDRWYEFTGVPHGSTDGDSWNGLFHPDDQERAWMTWRHSLRTGEPYHIEYRLRHRSGQYRWVIGRAQCERDASGTITRWYGTCTDIHDLKETEARLRESEERLRLSTENAEIGFWDVDVVHDVLTWPARTKAMFGISPDVPVTLRDFFDGLHPDDREAISAAYAAAADPQRRAFYDVEYRTVGKEDGLVRWLAAKGRGVFDESGQCVRMVGTVLDITARKAIEERLRELNDTLERRVREEVAERIKTEDALRQSQKMEAVGQLTGGIAHDFNNLLAGIVGSLELMQTRIRQGRTGEIPRYVQAAMTSAQRAAALTHRLLAYSRRQPLDPKIVDANRLVTSMEDLLRRTLGPQVDLEIRTAGGLWATLCDPHQLENALLNLAINARDAMPEGGKLTIETMNAFLDDVEPDLTRADVQPSRYVGIAITDTGTGMPAHVIARAFDPFFTTKPVGRGTGLGLSMVYGFVKQSLGHVRIHSEEGRGTCVRLYLPHYSGERREGEATQTFADPPRSPGGETVLVVDDEAVVRGVIVDVLTDLGYQALEAKDGPEALVLLGDVGRRIDLLVTDVGLPNGISGRQLADEARQRRMALKVLFITGYAENAVPASGMLEDGMAMLTKPFSVDGLARRVRDMLQDGSGS